MQTPNRTHPNGVVVKLVGSRGLVNSILETLEEKYYAVRTSDFLNNSDNTGVHIFLKVVGVRE